jgi:hypothetical protein
MEVPNASKVSAIVWASAASGAAKKRRKRKSLGGADGGEEDVLLVATNKGDTSSVVVYTPIKGEVLRTIPLSAKATAAWSDEHGVIVATASNLLVLGRDIATVAHTFALPSTASAPSAVALSPHRRSRPFTSSLPTLQSSPSTFPSNRPPPSPTRRRHCPCLQHQSPALSPCH